MSLGAKEGLIANKAIQDIENSEQRKFFEMYFDVRKAFELVNHASILETLEYYEVQEQVVNSIEYMTTKWSLKMRYNDERKNRDNKVTKRNYTWRQFITTDVHFVSEHSVKSIK